MGSLMEKLEYYLHFFGYAKDELSDSDHVTDYQGHQYPKFDFYDFKGKASAQNKKAHMDFINFNEKML